MVVEKIEYENPRNAIGRCGDFSFSNTSQILDNYSFSIFLFTNSLKSLPFSKFLESKARS